MRSIPSGKEGQFFRNMMGPGAEGTLDRGDPMNLAEPYVATASYRLPSAIAVPGPGALPFSLSFKPFYFTELVAGNQIIDFYYISILFSIEIRKIDQNSGNRRRGLDPPFAIY